MTHTPEFLACYDKNYGTSYRPQSPDLSKCAALVQKRGHGCNFYQCARKNGHGPHGAYCKQHDPVAVKARQVAQSEKWRSEAEEKRRKYVFQSDCMAAIREIAGGHNDPRGLAQAIIAKLEAKA